MNEMLPEVRTSRMDVEKFDSAKIIDSLERETGINRDAAEKVTKTVLKRIIQSNVQWLSGPQIREMACSVLAEMGLLEARRKYTRIGMPLMDYHTLLTQGIKENANQYNNPESIHSWAADRISAEYALLNLLTEEQSKAHLRGDIHVHMLRYFDLRPFCVDGSTKIPIIKENILANVKAKEFDAYFTENESFVDVSPENLFFMTPSGPRRLKYVTRKKSDQQMYKIQTSRGKEIVLSKDHGVMIFPNSSSNPKEVRVKNLRINDRIKILNSSVTQGSTHRINLIEYLAALCPPEDLETIYVRNLRVPLLAVKHGNSYSWEELFHQAQILEYPRSWERGNIPLIQAIQLIRKYSLDIDELELGIEGSPYTLPTKIELDTDLLRLIGYFVSDGNYNIQENQTYNLVLTNKNPDILEDMESCIRNSFSTYITRATYEDKAPQIYFGGKMIYLIFRYVFGIEPGNENKSLSSVFYNVTDPQLKSLLEGLYSGDGHVIYRPEKSDCHVIYTSRSKSLVDFLSLVLSMHDIGHSIKKERYEVDIPPYYKEGMQYRVKIYGVRNIRRLSLIMQFRQPEKQEKIDQFMRDHHPRTAIPNLPYDTITKITPVTPDHPFMYDFSLEGNGAWEQHTFYAETILIHNCQEWDLRMILKHGLPPCGWAHSAVSKPANHAMVAFLHVAKWLGIVQGEFSGGQGYDNFTVFLAPYLRGASYEDAKQLAQCFLFESNQIYAARGAQVPFTSISCLPTVPDSLSDVPAVSFSGKYDGVYGDYVDECNLLFRALSEVYYQGDGTGKLFNFPKHEIKLKKKWLTEFEDEYLLISEEAAKFGLPYYLNMVADWMPDEVHSQCLPYSEQLIARINGEIKFIPIGKMVTEELRTLDYHESKIKEPTWIEPQREIDVLSINPVSREIEFQPVTSLMYNPNWSKIIQFTSEGGLQISTNEAHPLIVLDPLQQKLVARKACDVESGDYILKMTKWDAFIDFPKKFDLIDILIELNEIDNVSIYGIDNNFLRRENQTVLSKILDVPKDRIGWWRRSNSITLKSYLKLEENSNERTNLKLVPKGGKGFINAKIKCDEKLMAFLGYYLAEGSIHKDRGIRLSFNPNEHQKITEVESLINEVFGLRTKKRIQIDPERNYNHCNINVNSYLLLKLIKYWDLGNDARSKKLPNFIFNLPNELTKHLIRTLFLGDGYFRIMEKSVEVSLHITSEKLVEGIYHLLLKHGINSTIRRKEDSINLSIERHESMELFMNYIPEWRTEYYQKRPDHKRYLATISKRYPATLVDKARIQDRKVKGIVSQIQKQNRTLGDQFLKKVPEQAKSQLLQILMKSEYYNLVKIVKKEIIGEADHFYDVEVGKLGPKGNFIHGDGLVTHNCCRIILTPEGLRKVCSDPDIFDWSKSYMNMGSLQSVSLNLPRYAYQAQGDDDLLFEVIDQNLELARDILFTKQEVIRKAMENKLIPICASEIDGVPLLDFRKQSLSVGFVGLNECVLAHTDYELHENATAYELGKKVLMHLSKRCEEFTDESLLRSTKEKPGVKFSLWEQPAESTSERFAKLDLIHYKDYAIPLGDRDSNSVYYTNSDHLNYAADISLFDRIEKQAAFHPIVQGGVITHIWMGEAYPDPEGLWKFTKAIAHTPTAYFAFTKDFTQCLKCLKFINGIYNVCPHCGASGDNIEWWSRVTGYYSRVKRFNQGKMQEWHDRKRYNVATVNL